MPAIPGFIPLLSIMELHAIIPVRQDDDLAPLIPKCHGQCMRCRKVSSGYRNINLFPFPHKPVRKCVRIDLLSADDHC